MSNYHRDVYEKTFARLLNKALRIGANDPLLALKWINKSYRLAFMLIMTQHRVETIDALIDVREHLNNRTKITNKKDEKN